MKKILTIIGARPQFIKAAVISRAIGNESDLTEIIVHTGQHYDQNMSQIFFDELQIPKPHYNLEVGSAAHGKQTGEMLIKIEEVMLLEKPDIVLLYGDTNSTIAGSVAASKLHIPIAHIEAGLRGFDKKVPEEVNRIVTDHLSKLLFCPTKTAVTNLKNEGITEGVHQTGDVMFDSTIQMLTLAQERSKVLTDNGLSEKEYILATIHRAENTDKPARLKAIFSALKDSKKKIIMPLHPRTKKYISEYKIEMGANIQIIDPVGYLDNLILIKNAEFLVTDSGGMQKEAYFLATPCLTLRENTEWVETVESNANYIVGADQALILELLNKAAPKLKDLPEHYGDGSAGQKIIEIIKNGL